MKTVRPLEGQAQQPQPLHVRLLKIVLMWADARIPLKRQTSRLGLERQMRDSTVVWARQCLLTYRGSCDQVH